MIAIHNFTKKNQKPLIIEYKNGYNGDDFQEYFEKYKNIFIDKKIAYKDIWNIDETRFCIDYGKAYWVITFDSNKLIFLTYPDNQKYIILVESIKGKRVRGK